MSVRNVNYDFSGCNIVITGASGAIGSKIAKEFALAGSNLILLEQQDREEQLEKLREEISLEFSIRVDTFYADICNFAQVEEITKAITEKYDKIDILVNNAGTNRLIPAIKLKEDDWDTIVDTNLKGTFAMCQGIGRKMIDDEDGVIINIASQHGIVGNELRVPYCSSKAGIINMTRCYALEWAKYNIRVNCVSPTFVVSEGNKAFLEQPVTKKKYIPRIPMARYCVPEDVAACVLFLSTSAASMITGQNLVVDGGYTAG